MEEVKEDKKNHFWIKSYCQPVIEDHKVVRFEKTDYVFTNIKLCQQDDVDFYLWYINRKDSYAFFLGKKVKLDEHVKHELRHVNLLYNFKGLMTYALHLTDMKDPTYIWMLFKIEDFETLDSFITNYQATFGKLPSEKLIQHFSSQLIDIMKFLHERNFIHRNLSMKSIILVFDQEAVKMICETEDIEPFSNTYSLGKVLRKCGTIPFTNEVTKLNKLFYYNNRFTITEENFERVMLKSALKLADFRLANIANNKGKCSTLCFNDDCFKPPEMILPRRNEFYDNSVDAWSFGIILYYMSFGFSPFSYTNDVDYFKLLNNGTYQLPLNRELSYQFIDFLARLLLMEPQLRFDFEKMTHHDFIKQPTDKFHWISSQDIKPEASVIEESESQSKNSITMSIHEKINIKSIRKVSKMIKEIDLVIDSDSYFNEMKYTKYPTENTLNQQFKIKDYEVPDINCPKDENYKEMKKCLIF